MTIVPQSPDADLVDRRYLSQFASEQVGLALADFNGPFDPDNETATVTLAAERDGTVVFARPADRLSVGTFATTLTSAETSVPGPYTVTFDYTVAGVPDTYVLHLLVGSSAPDYDRLPVGMKMIVEQVMIRFADLYDAPLGGPHLQIYLQSHFGRNRIAQLLRQGVGRLNTISQPYSTYAADEKFPLQQWGPLLEQVLYVEVLKHLRRSYVEQPEVILGTAISRLDRRDYMDRWGVILAEEAEDLKEMMSTFKMANMGLGSVSVLVSGGAFGNYGPVANVGGFGLGAARGYFFGTRMF